MLILIVRFQLIVILISWLQNCNYQYGTAVFDLSLLLLHDTFDRNCDVVIPASATAFL